MENSDRKRMYEFGEWLEQYLNPSIHLNEYKKLVETGIQLCNLEFCLSKDDIMLQNINYIAQQQIEVQNFILKRKNDRNLYLEELELERDTVGGGGYNGLIYIYENWKSYRDKIELADPSKIQKIARTVLLTIYSNLGSLIESYPEEAPEFKSIEDEKNYENRQSYFEKDHELESIEDDEHSEESLSGLNDIFENWSVTNSQLPIYHEKEQEIQGISKS